MESRPRLRLRYYSYFFCSLSSLMIKYEHAFRLRITPTEVPKRSVVTTQKPDNLANDIKPRV